ncbi:MAG: chromosome segregation protein SMC [Gammaproteobacteria bacterium]|nr:chromosome segregation protein SMC [Gammaproteobacteria bacterium]
MRLNKIKLAGFKSFVDPTTILLPSALVGIVGPNGCGKSNVIDAVRWVMGESSAKYLRGESMTDVIFNGSSARKPVGQASTELVFDNSDGSLGGQYAQYSEISVKRRVTREGQSHYFLNGTRCRRRDITDVFLGTGLGPRSYAIIEQGTISRFVEAKPDDLRVYIEEAAGISKYKERRRETENRIRHCRDNLLRIDDLREELGKRLQQLQRQARTAERYKELKQQERLLKAQLLALRWRSQNEIAEALGAQIKSKETALEAGMAELRRIEAGMEKLRAEQSEASDTFNAVQGEFYSVGAEISRLEQSIQHGRETLQRQQRERAEVARSLEEGQTHLAADRDQISDLSSALAEHEPAYENARSAEQHSSAQLRDAEQALHGWQSEWDEFNKRASAQLHRAEVERANLQHIEQQVKQLNQRRDRLNSDLQRLSAEALEQEIAPLQVQLGELDARIESTQQILADQRASLAEQRETNQRGSAALDDSRRLLQSSQGRLASLEALQQSALGKGGSPAAKWLESNGLSDRRRVAEALSVESGWEHAVEAVLGLHLEAICIEGGEQIEQIAAQLGALQRGTVTVMDTHNAPPGSLPDTVTTRLVSKVNAVPWLAPALSGIYAAESLDDALALRARLAENESVVTRDGLWCGCNWLRIVRPDDEQAGVLAREQEIKKLRQQLQKIRAQVAESEQHQAQGSAQLKALEEQREATQSMLQAISRQHAELRAQLSGKQARLDHVRSQIKRHRDEIEEIQSQLIELEARQVDVRGVLHEALASAEISAEERSALQARRNQHLEAIERNREQARNDRNRAHELALSVQSSRARLESVRSSMTRWEGQLTHLTRRREALDETLAGAEAPLKALNETLEQVLSQRSSVEAKLSAARKRLEEVEHDMRAAEADRSTIEQKILGTRDGLEKLRIEGQELKVRGQTLTEQIAETGFELDALFEALPELAHEQAWQQQVEQMSARIQRLGAINLAAIDEFSEQSERKTYLDAQNADLVEALETLEDAIRKIDRETRARFKATYDKVNSGLQSFFPRMFGGGHAYLELTGEDLLDTGVSIMARPPGKRNSSIQLLSGGEKALTAVALVFAIFEINPAPFCMLDEVDAPLDDTNVERFCKVVEEMSERVQFIFITHNKVTMEMAQHLSGVTMHEAGVSRMVTVDVDAAAALAGA